MKKSAKYLSNNTNIHAIIFSFPFLFIMFYDFFLMKRTWETVPNDSVASFFSLGLNWLSLKPRPFFHHPSYFFHMLSGLIIKIIGLPKDYMVNGYMQLFNNFGIFFHLITLLLIAYWCGKLFVRLNISIFITFLIGSLIATMPTMILYSTVWGNYYITGLLLVPIGLTIFLAIKTRKWCNATTFPALMALGFCAANFYPIFMIIFILFLLLFSSSSTIFPEKIRLFNDEKKDFNLTKIILLFFTLSLFVWNVLFPAKIKLNIHPIILVSCALIVTFLFLLIIPRFSLFYRLMHVYCLPILIGWTIGSNYHAICGYSFVNFYKHILRYFFPYQKLLYKFDLATFFFTESWRLTFLIFTLCAVYIFWQYFRKKNYRDSSQLIISLFIFLIISINFLIAPKNIYYFNNYNVNPSRYGLLCRFFIATLVIVPIVVISINQFNIWLQRLLYIIFCVICIFSFCDYLNSFGPRTKIFASENIKLKCLVTQHLTKHPNGIVIFERVEHTDWGGILYGYNCAGYRSKESIKKLRRNSLYGGRIIFSRRENTPNLILNSEGLVLLIQWQSHFPWPQSEIIWFSKTMRLWALLINPDTNRQLNNHAKISYLFSNWSDDSPPDLWTLFAPVTIFAMKESNNIK